MSDIDIAELMAPLGPFERSPAVAAAVSGGSDSLGLGLLLADWVRANGGRLHVLTVDHGLRPEAAGECAHVAGIFAAISGCSAHVLRWDGAKPARGLQAAARTARYRLLAGWCRGHGILHLAVAHTADDQSETVAMRRSHGSGPLGLAGMAAVRPEAGVRLLRPLLGVSRAAIRDWLSARGQRWLEDPSNQQAKFERVRVRQGLSREQSAALLEDARRHGAARDRAERDAARLLAEAGEAHDGGYLSIALAALAQAPGNVRALALQWMILAVSGADYAPVLDALPGSFEAARTIGGCVLQARQGRLFVCREAAAIEPSIAAGPGWTGPWDGRFALRVSGDLPAGAGWAIRPLGEVGLRQAVARFGARQKRHPMPLVARLALPALWQGEHVAAQPHLGLGQGLAARAAPRHTVTSSGFTVAAGRPHTIYS